MFASLGTSENRQTISPDQITIYKISQRCKHWLLSVNDRFVCGGLQDDDLGLVLQCQCNGHKNLSV